MPGDRGFDPTRHLAFGDVRLSSHQDPQFMVVPIKASKTDPYRQGGVNLPWANPRRAVPRGSCTQLMVQWGTRAGPFFLFRDNKQLTREQFVGSVQNATDNRRLQCLRDTAAVRIGAATTAAQQGIQDALIKALGRWESAAWCFLARKKLKRGWF